MTFKTIMRVAAAVLASAVPATANAQLFFTQPSFEVGPVEPGDSASGIDLPGATQAELRAALLWTLRSGLNVAALQCQFSPYLRAVDNYNAILDHHSVELARAYTAIGGYFRRTHGQRDGQRMFDTWSTTNYNNFSSLYGQLGFCQTASDIAKETLARRKGEMYDVARNRLRELRSSQRAVTDRLATPGAILLQLQPLPPTLFAGPNCTGLRGRDLRRCQGQ
jgi:hypothetical protein